MQAAFRREILQVVGFVVYVAVIASQPVQVLLWDGLSFLLAARDGAPLDFGHLLYVPALQLAAWAAPASLGSADLAAKLLSTLAGGLTFVLLWRTLERAGTRSLAALLTALLVTTTPLFWRQAGIVEPTTLTMACLLLVAAAAERYGSERSPTRLALLTGTCLLALVLHLASVFALPWILRRARGTTRVPGKHIAAVLGTVSLAFLAIGATGGLDRLPGFLRYWISFLPDDPSEVGTHIRTMWAILAVGTTVLTLFGIAGGIVAARLDRDRVVDALWLGLPYGLAMLLMGKPVAALMTPLTLALGLAAGAGIAGLQRNLGRIPLLLFATGLVLQVGYASLVARLHALTPDANRTFAEEIERRLDETSVVLAGPLAQHLEWYTDVTTIGLPNVMQLAKADDGSVTPRDAVDAEAQRLYRDFAAVYLTNEALDYLVLYWGLPQDAWSELKRETLLEEPRLELIRLPTAQR